MCSSHINGELEQGILKGNCDTKRTVVGKLELNYFDNVLIKSNAILRKKS